MTYSHSTTGTQAIRDALLLCGGIGADEPIEGDATTDALRAANNLLKSWQAQGMHMWVRKEATLFPVVSQAEYSLGPATTDAHWAETYVSTNLNGAAASAATSFPVDSVTSMSVDDNIGIALTDGTRQWTTIKSISSLTITPATALTGAASDNGTVYTYTSRPQRPLRIIHARRSEASVDVDVDIESLNEYFDQPDKTSNGTIVFVAYKPTLTSGKLFLWQTAGNADQLLKFTFEHPLSDITAAAALDLPQEWYQAFTYNLADRIEPQYRIIDAGRRRELKQNAQMYLQEALDFDADTGSISFQPG